MPSKDCCRRFYLITSLWINNNNNKTIVIPYSSIHKNNTCISVGPRRALLCRWPLQPQCVDLVIARAATWWMCLWTCGGGAPPSPKCDRVEWKGCPLFAPLFAAEFITQIAKIQVELSIFVRTVVAIVTQTVIAGEMLRPKILPFVFPADR